MRIASTVALTALALVVLAHGGVLACGASDRDFQEAAGAAGTAGGGTVAGAGGGLASAGAGSAGAPAGSAGSAGSAGAAAGSGGASAGAGGTAGSAGSAGNSGGNAGAAGSMGGSGGAAPFALTSPSFANKQGCTKDTQGPCDKFPAEVVLPAIGGMNKSPELNWAAGPAGTLSYAVVLHDESNGFTHWAIWNIPGATRKLPAALPAGPSPAGLSGAVQAGFSGGMTEYSGPGAKMHAYRFKVYALKVASISPTLKQGAVRTTLEASADVVAEAELRAATNP